MREAAGKYEFDEPSPQQIARFLALMHDEPSAVGHQQLATKKLTAEC